jgi:hypothetical protein
MPLMIYTTLQCVTVLHLIDLMLSHFNTHPPGAIGDSLAKNCHWSHQVGDTQKGVMICSTSYRTMRGLLSVGGVDSKQHWYDLCAGPHVQSTGDINPGAISLESVWPSCCHSHPRVRLALECCKGEQPA